MMSNKYKLTEIDDSDHECWYYYNIDRPIRFKVIRATYKCPVCDSKEFVRRREGPYFDHELICFNRNFHENTVTWECDKLYIVSDLTE